MIHYKGQTIAIKQHNCLVVIKLKFGTIELQSTLEDCKNLIDKVNYEYV